jgi:hypothetical protein
MYTASKCIQSNIGVTFSRMLVKLSMCALLGRYPGVGYMPKYILMVARKFFQRCTVKNISRFTLHKNCSGCVLLKTSGIFLLIFKGTLYMYLLLEGFLKCALCAMFLKVKLYNKYLEFLLSRNKIWYLRIFC